MKGAVLLLALCTCGCSLIVGDDPPDSAGGASFVESFDDVTQVMCVEPSVCFLEGPPREAGTGLCNFVESPAVLRADEFVNLQDTALSLTFAFNVFSGENADGARATFLSLGASQPIELIFSATTVDASSIAIRAQVPVVEGENPVLRISTPTDTWNTLSLSVLPVSPSEGLLRLSAANQTEERMIQTSELSRIELGCIAVPVPGFTSPLAFDEFSYSLGP